MNTFESLRIIFTTSSEIEEPLTDEEIDIIAQFCFISVIMLSQLFLLCLMNPSEQSSPSDQAPANEDNEVRNVEMPPFPTNEPATTSRKVYSDVWSAPRTKPRHVRRLFNDEDSEDNVTANYQLIAI